MRDLLSSDEFDHTQTKGELSFGKDILSKVKLPREFDETAKMMSKLSGLDFTSIYKVEPQVKQEWPSALENLY